MAELLSVLQNAGLLLVVLTLVWLLSLALHNAAIVDVAWGLGFILVAGVTWLRSPRDEHATWLLLVVTVWGARLALHIFWRGRGKPEDARYQKLRARFAPFWWKSFFVVFMLQGVLLLTVSLPVQLGMAARDFTVVDAVGLAVFVLGFFIEATADLQLAMCKKPGEVMARGLWRYSRHPNYFGELVLWWGIGVLALSPSTWWASLLGPALISFLLLRVSGVPMLEEQMQARPGWAEYAARTSAFWPRPPRRIGAP